MNQLSDSESGDSDRGIRYKTDSTRETSTLIIECKESNFLEPILPPSIQKNNLVAPVLPPHLQKNINTEYKRSSSGSKNSVLGPELPPHLQKSLQHEEYSVKSTPVGPSLPPHLQISSHRTTLTSSPRGDNNNQWQNNEVSYQNNYIGPALPAHLRQKLSKAAELQESDDEEEVYGPVPAGFTHSKAHIELEERALQMKIDMLNPKGEKEPTREEWMLELPATKTMNFGLGPRQFRAKEAPDLSDRSSWTDTPEDRAKKKEKKEKTPMDIKKDAELRETKKRDKEQDAIAKKCKRSNESLIDMHIRETKKKKDESGSSERRPFSRDVDLQVNRFDEARKKAVLKKAQLLDTRFSAGESKFL